MADTDVHQSSGYEEGLITLGERPTKPAGWNTFTQGSLEGWDTCKQTSMVMKHILVQWKDVTTQMIIKRAETQKLNPNCDKDKIEQTKKYPWLFYSGNIHMHRQQMTGK